MVRWWVWLCVLLWVWPVAQAAEVKNLYEGTVFVENRDRDVRNEAFKSALNQVLVKVTGNASLADQDDVGSLMDTASRYVSRYSYAQASQGETEGFDLTVVFDQTALERAMLDRALPMWGSERPSVLLWMAVNDRPVRYLLGRTQSNELPGVINQIADQRGIPLGLPLMDGEDQNSLSVAEVNGLFENAVDAASERYAPDAVLMAKAFPSGGDWRIQWRLLWDRQQYDWNTQSSSQQQAVVDGIQALASTMAQSMAVTVHGDVGNQVIVQVDGVHTLMDNATVRSYLSDLSQVTSVRPYLLQPRTASFFVTLRGDLRDLQRLLLLGGNLQAMPKPVDTTTPVIVDRVNDPAMTDSSPTSEPKPPSPQTIYYRWLG